MFDKTTDDDDLFWFMWYQNGKPMIPLSGVISADKIINVISNIKEIKF